MSISKLAPVRDLITRYFAVLYTRSLEIPPFLSRRMALAALLWLLFCVPFALFKLSRPAAPIHNLGDAQPILIAYGAIMAAPICGYLLAACAFTQGKDHKPLDFHLSFIGKWRKVDAQTARASPHYGPVGFLASLLIGLLLNVVVRTGEYFTAIPAVSMHAPDWGMAMFTVMSADVVFMNFLYMVAFVMALRNVPLFPRMLLYAWLVDLFMQLVIARHIAGAGSIPPEVAAPLVDVLQGNIVKVAISMVVWLPYLLVSRRVNMTYRMRERG